MSTAGTRVISGHYSSTLTGTPIDVLFLAPPVPPAEPPPVSAGPRAADQPGRSRPATGQRRPQPHGKAQPHDRAGAAARTTGTASTTGTKGTTSKKDTTSKSSKATAKAGRAGRERRRILLLDLQNACSMYSRPTRWRSSLQAIQDAAGPVARTVAAVTHEEYAQHRALLDSAGVEIKVVSSGRNAVDHALLDIAQREAQRGCREFCVASGDHIFGRLNKYGRLVVIRSSTGSPASGKLLRAAHEVKHAA